MSARIIRRAIFAAIALQTELPAPRTIACVDYGLDAGDRRLDICLDSVEDLHAWLPYFGMTEKNVSAQPYTHKEEPHAGQKTTLANAYSRGEWRGWRVHLSALDPVGETEPALDETTRDQLREIAEVTP